MTQIGFESPLSQGTTLELPAESWNELRTLMEGRTAPGTVPGRHGPHLVARWRADSGSMTAHRRVVDGGEVTVETARPASQEQAAQVGAMMIYAARSGRRVRVDLLPPPNGRTDYRDLSMRSCAWAVGRLGSGAGWPIRPSLVGR